MDVGVATLIGSGLSLSGGLFSNRTNRLIAKENLAYQREANEKNMQLVREANANNIAFQQQENEITRMREDNAVRRAAADMTAAGLSKTLAAGQPASAAALSAPSVQAASVSPVNNSYRYESALQKMNIAGLLQDMAVKSEQLKQSEKLNDANVDLIKAQAQNYNLQNGVFMENFGNEQLLKLSNISLNNAKVESERAQARLTSIIGDYKAEEVQADIDLKVKQTLYYNSQILYNEKSREKIAFEIAEIIARSHKLSKEAELVIKDIAYKDLEIEGYTHNLEYARKTGLPVGSMPGGLFGSGLSTGMTLKNLIRDFLNRNDTSFSFNPGVGMDIPTWSNSGGHAW